MRITDDLLIDNMVMYIEDFIENLHKKDPAAIKGINDNLSSLQDRLQSLNAEMASADEWTQEDMIEMAALNLLLATSMGVPSIDKDDDDNDEMVDL